jgi:hypothetical protein
MPFHWCPDIKHGLPLTRNHSVKLNRIDILQRTFKSCVSQRTPFAKFLKKGVSFGEIEHNVKLFWLKY